MYTLILKRRYKGSIVGTGKVVRVDPIRNPRKENLEKYVTGIPTDRIELENVVLFDPPVSIRPLLARLDFIKHKQKWGAYLQGGCRRIATSDFEKFVRAASGSSKKLLAAQRTSSKPKRAKRNSSIN